MGRRSIELRNALHRPGLQLGKGERGRLLRERPVGLERGPKEGDREKGWPEQAFRRW